MEDEDTVINLKERSFLSSASTYRPSKNQNLQKINKNMA